MGLTSKITTILLLGSFCLPVFGQEEKEGKELSYGGEVKIHVHKIKLDQGKTYRFTVEADGFTPAIGILSRFGGSRHNSAPTRFGRKTYLVYTPNRTQEYQFYVDFGYQAQVNTGKLEYQFSVEEASFMQAKSFENKIDLPIQKVKLEKGVPYTISLITKGYSPNLWLMDENKIINRAYSRSVGRSYIANVMYTPPETKEYRLFVKNSSTVTHEKAQLDYALEIAKLKPSLSVVGRWTREDPFYKNRPGSYFKAHEQKLKAGIQYNIDLTSSIDTYLFLEDSQGKVLYRNDDGGSGLNARITFRPSKTDTYRIIATTFGSQRVGNYTLTVLEQGTKGKGELIRGKISTRMDWMPLIKDTTYRLVAKAEGYSPMIIISGNYGTTTTSNQPKGGEYQMIYAAKRTHDGYFLVHPDSRGPIGKGPHKYSLRVDEAQYALQGKEKHLFEPVSHEVTMEEGKFYRALAQSSTFRPNIALADNFEIIKTQNGRRLQNQNQYESNMVIYPKETGKYRLFVTKNSYDRIPPGGARYVLKFKTLKPSKKFTGKLTGEEPKYNNAPYAIHKIDLEANKTYHFNLHSEEFSPTIQIKNASGTILRYEGYNDIRNSRLSYRPTVKGTYSIVVTSYNSRSKGAYTVSVLD